jgi:hypothetical protein
MAFKGAIAPLKFISPVNLIFMIRPTILQITYYEVGYAIGYFLSIAWPFLLVSFLLCGLKCLFEMEERKIFCLKESMIV